MNFKHLVVDGIGYGDDQYSSDSRSFSFQIQGEEFDDEAIQQSILEKERQKIPFVDFKHDKWFVKLKWNERIKFPSLYFLLIYYLERPFYYYHFVIQ